jgi:thiol-disulfide isomerase/thioredoxin
VRVWALAILCAMTTGLVGCSNFGKKSAAPNNPPVRGTPQAGAAGGPYDRADTAPAPTAPSGVLAGQVLDSFNRTPIAATYIQVSEAGEGGKSAAPIEVATDNHGYFMIQRLQPGHHYQLTARMKQGDRLLAGTAFATPPNPKILIQISEDFATKHTPDPPGPPKFPSSPKNSIPGPDGPPTPVWPDQASGASSAPNAGGSNNAPPPTPPEQAWAPGNVPRNDPYINGAGSQGQGAKLGPPTGMFGTPPPAPTPVPQGSPSPVILRPEGIVKDNSQVRADPLVEIRPQVPQATPVPAGPARIPSCVLTGNTLYNFALYDLNGQPWEFRHHQGRLVLLDFWGTWCSHCLVSVKDLNALQDRYGRYGLEVIGIDYEGDTPPQDQILKVRGARQRYGMNYRILLGGNQETCPVRAQFGVRNFPSAFLIDESNHVIWSSEGLGRQQVRELEIIIRQRLGLR